MLGYFHTLLFAVYSYGAWTLQKGGLPGLFEGRGLTELFKDSWSFTH